MEQLSQALGDLCTQRHLIQFIFLSLALVVGVFLACFCDLLTGIRRAKKLGVYRSSKKLRKTADKLANYGTVMLVTAIPDVFLQIALNLYGIAVPAMPMILLVTCMYLLYTEYISLRENLTDPTTKETMKQVESFLTDFASQYGPEILGKALSQVKVKDKESREE